MQAADSFPGPVSHDPRETLRQVRRALELLELGLSTLREQSSAGLVRDLVDRVQQALRGLTKFVQNRPHAELELLKANQTLDAALALVSDRSILSARQSQALEAIARAQALLYPYAAARDPVGSRPPRVLPRRKPSQPPPMPQDNRRKSPRVDLKTEVTWEGASNFYTGFSEDLSDGGLFVATYDLQPIGTKIELSFTLPNGHVVNVEGVVRWTRDLMDDNLDAPPGMGVMFEELPPEDREAIQTFCEGRAPLFYDDDTVV